MKNNIPLLSSRGIFFAWTGWGLFIAFLFLYTPHILNEHTATNGSMLAMASLYMIGGFFTPSHPYRGFIRRSLVLLPGLPLALYLLTLPSLTLPLSTLPALPIIAVYILSGTRPVSLFISLYHPQLEQHKLESWIVDILTLKTLTSNTRPFCARYSLQSNGDVCSLEDPADHTALPWTEQQKTIAATITNQINTKTIGHRWPKEWNNTLQDGDGAATLFYEMALLENPSLHKLSIPTLSAHQAIALKAKYQ